jgi:hypothetical protein
MSMYFDQMHAHIKQFESQIAVMAWGIVDQVIEEQRRKLTSGLTEIAIKADRKVQTKSSEPTKASHKLALLYKKVGTWSRGGGTYRVLGPGKKPETFDLEDIKSGKKINATVKTLTSRWKHFA